VQVRLAQVEDALGIATVHVRSWQSAYRGLVPQDFLDGLDPTQRCMQWERVLTSQAERETTLVAEEAGEVVGFAHVCPSRDDQAPSTVGELTSVYLLAEAWGRGFGRDLMGSAVSAMREAGFAQATLWVLAGNHRARRFYEAAGWSTDGATKQDDLRGFVLEEVRYRLTLS
jgi:GNAT superfamily N-acetyltransferase